MNKENVSSKLTSDNIKFRVVYVPFLLVAIGTLLFYGLFRWLFDFEFGILPFKEDVLSYWLPIALPWIPVTLWLRRRIRILNVNGKNDNGYFLYQLIMGAAIAVPILCSQYYLERSAFDLVEVNAVGDIKERSNEKYFKVRNFHVDYVQYQSYVTSRVSGRTSENLNFHLFFACPFQDVQFVWYGLDYKKNLSNRLSEQKKDLEYKRFVDDSWEEFKIHDFHDVEYFVKLGNSSERDGFVNAILVNYPDYDKSDQIILVPETQSFEERYGDSFFWIYASFVIGAFVVLMMTMIPEIEEKEYRDFKKRIPLRNDDLKDFLAFLDPRGSYKATSWLIIVNTLVIVVMLFDGISIVYPSAIELLDYGGNRRLEVLRGEYWRLLTAVFIHSGIIHLILNMVGLGLAGVFLEKVLKPAKLILSFLVCGVLASIASIYWFENVVSIGASGAIFGLFGIILVFVLSGIFPPYKLTVLWTFLLFYVGFGFLMGFIGGYDNAAHVGGLISGVLLGGIFIAIDRNGLVQNALGRRKKSFELNSK